MKLLSNIIDFFRSWMPQRPEVPKVPEVSQIPNAELGYFPTQPELATERATPTIPQPVQPQMPPAGIAGYNLTITARSIMRSIDEQPARTRKDYANSYIGKKVAWEVALESVESSGGGKAKLSFYPKGTSKYPAILCGVLFSDYPQLNQLRQGTAFWVTGEIANIYRVVTLKFVTLHFPS